MLHLQETGSIRHGMYSRSVACSVTRTVPRPAGMHTDVETLALGGSGPEGVPTLHTGPLMSSLERLRFLRRLSRACAGVLASEPELRTGVAALLRPQAVRSRLDVGGLDLLLSVEAAHSIFRCVAGEV